MKRMCSLVALLILIALVSFPVVFSATAATLGYIDFQNNSNTLVSIGAIDSTQLINAPPGSYYFGLLTSPQNIDPPVWSFSGVYATNTTMPGAIDGGASVVVPGWQLSQFRLIKVVGWSANLGHDWNDTWLWGGFPAGMTNAFFGISTFGMTYPGDPTPGPLFEPGDQPFAITSGFNLFPVPERLLAVTHTNHQISLTWPGWATNFVLEEAAAIAQPSNWTNSPVTPVLVNNSFTITLPLSDSARFYRLRPLFLPPPAFAMQTNDGTITITGYSGNYRALIIPGTINGLPVTSIGSSAFAGNSLLTNVVISTGVTTIEASAFSNCTNLTSVSIPTTVNNIGDWAFSACPLTSVNILNVTNIGQGAFRFCQELTDLTVGAKATTIGSSAFAYCTGLTNIVMEDGVASIGTYAFQQSGLTSIIIPNSVAFISDDAFYTCSNLANVALSDSTTSIGNQSFAWCESLTNITFPSSITNISDYAFGWCYGLKGAYFMGNAPTGPHAFSFDPAIIYYLAGTTGWSSTFAGLPTAVWTSPP